MVKIPICPYRAVKEHKTASYLHTNEQKTKGGEQSSAFYLHSSSLKWHSISGNGNAVCPFSYLVLFPVVEPPPPLFFFLSFALLVG